MALHHEHPQRLVALFVLGCVLFSVTVLGIFGGGGKVLGVPLLYVYLFGAWAVLVALMAIVVERSD